jgi:signal transduction histidine kinase
MGNTAGSFEDDIAMIQGISIVPSLLELVCTITGMGFSAIARVTEDKWIACATRDEIGFGLKPGGELAIKTTICDEIRQNRQLVVFDEAAADPQFCNHHTPKMYGLQSYISVPIVLNDGSFFGTLCAIDPNPREVNNEKTILTFQRFADLIALHIKNIDQLVESNNLLTDTNRKMTNLEDENRQYQHITNHTLQEPLRKIQVFTDQLARMEDFPEGHKARIIASRINTLAKDFSSMIFELTNFSEIIHSHEDFELTDLNKVLFNVCNKLRLQIADKKAVIKYDALHTIKAIPSQMSRLFYHLINNALKFSKPDIAPLINIWSKDITADHPDIGNHLSSQFIYCEICFEDNGIGMEADELKSVFDIFYRANPAKDTETLGIGLAQCRKIVLNHKGYITMKSEYGKGTTVSIILPLEKTS